MTTSTTTTVGVDGKRRLRVAGESFDLDAELRAFEEAERARLGLGDEKVEQWIEDMANLTFTKTEKSKITLLVGGLTLAQDTLVEGALRGVGYNVQCLDVPDTVAFQTGKEYGNRAQCNPTYFTVGNLVKTLITLRDKHGMTAKEIVDNYVFLTAGACGPCRFGMYVTEYRKALRDAGFDGFRVVLFQQTGGMKQATGEESGLELNPTFFWALAKAIFVGDVLNAIGYRLRPYEVEAGATDRALEEAKAIVYRALEKRENVLVAVAKARACFRKVKVDRLVAKPKVSIIGEFWAMTTEGDGNYGLQRFLEQEGAEDDIQLVAAWILYNIWEARHDTADRANLREHDKAKYGLAGTGPWGIFQKQAALFAAEVALRGLFQTFANLAGLHGYKLPDMDAIAEVSHAYYNNDLRGGEGHMEVGKLIMNVVHQKAHMTLSVKPFGCMPSAGVSDGVQSAITERYPGTIFCPVETSGDGKVNFYSRVQMYLFKAKQAAAAELERACEEHGVTLEQVREVVAASPRLSSPLFKAPHAYAGTAADLVAYVAPRITHTRSQRAALAVARTARRAKGVVFGSPKALRDAAVAVAERAPVLAGRLREDVTLFFELRASAKSRESVAAAAE